MSAVVRIEPIEAPAGVAVADLARLTAAAFGQRRKMLRQSLKGVPGALLAAVDALGIDRGAAGGDGDGRGVDRAGARLLVGRPAA